LLQSAAAKKNKERLAVWYVRWTFDALFWMNEMSLKTIFV
jgi:hypothetical protein